MRENAEILAIKNMKKRLYENEDEEENNNEENNNEENNNEENNSELSEN
jgi:hypothetical protein